MNLLPLETWNIILSLLEENNDKFHLLITFRDMLKCSVSFDDLVNHKKIIHSQWFNKFHSMDVDINFGDFGAVNEYYFSGPFPEELKHIQINYQASLDYELEMIVDITMRNFVKIPEGITHLIFNYNFYNKNQLRSGNLIVIKLNWSLRGNISDHLPSSLKYITFTANIVDEKQEAEYIHFIRNSDSSEYFSNEYTFSINTDYIHFKFLWDYDTCDTIHYDVSYNVD